MSLKSPAAQRQVAGGYIQLAAINYSDATTDQYDAFGKAMASELRKRASSFQWRIRVSRHLGTILSARRADREIAEHVDVVFCSRAHEGKGYSFERIIDRCDIRCAACAKDCSYPGNQTSIVGRYHCVAFHSMESPAASMMPSITSRNTFGVELQHEALGDEGAEHQRRAGDQAFQRDCPTSARRSAGT